MRSGRCSTEPQASEMYDLTKSFVSASERLAILGLRADVRGWKIPRAPYLCSFGGEDMLFSRVNCRFFHCFRDVDMVGDKRLVSAVDKALCEWVLTWWQLRLQEWRKHG